LLRHFDPCRDLRIAATVRERMANPAGALSAWQGRGA
jgi:hypothetical protein